nr:GntR family transcriptional regulator [uncultured Brevundimonas sp.]
MRQRDPFGSATTSLRRALEHGLAPGQHLSVADIAASLKLSTSPVREALSRLCGEGLVEDRRGLGYFTRSAPAEDIVGLLDLEAAHVRLAAEGAGVRQPPDGSDEAVETWIECLLEHCDSQPLVESLQRVRRRLAPLRRLNGPTALAEAHDSEPLDAYYARWRVAAGALAARFRRLDADGSEYMRNIV